MFFKKIVFVLFSLTVISCAREKELASAPITVNMQKSSQCLEQSGQHFKDYREGLLSDGEVGAYWDCVQDAISEFQKYTAGDLGPQVYSARGLMRFVYEHFFKGRSPSENDIRAFMEIKRILVKGSIEKITNDEIERAKSFLQLVKKSTIQLNRHARVVFLTEPAQSEEQLQNVQLNLRSSLAPLVHWLANNGEPFSLIEVKHFLSAIENLRFFERKSDWTDLEQLASRVKTLFLAGSHSELEGERWSDLGSMSIQVYSLVLQLNRAQSLDLNSLLVGATLPDCLDKVGALFQLALKYKSAIQLDEVARLFSDLESQSFLPKSINAEALSKATRWIVGRWLSHTSRSQALSAPQITRLLQFSSGWRELLTAAQSGKPYIGNLGLNFQSVLSRSQPLQWDSEGRLLLDRKKRTQWTSDDQAKVVWAFSLIESLKSSYVGSASEFDEDMMNFAVGEVLPLLQNFGLFQSTTLAIGKKILRQADLFLLSSNGDQKIDVAEAVHYLLLTASSFKTSQLWLSQADAQCENRDAECVRKWGVTSDALQALPNLKAAFQNRVQEFSQYLRQGEDTVLGSEVQGRYGIADLLQVLLIVQYVEMFDILYDTSKNELIDLPEALVAYQVYGPTLAHLLIPKGLPPAEVLAFYTFLMKYGETPFTLFGGSVLFLNWKLTEPKWQFDADRKRLLSILRQLAKL